MLSQQLHKLIYMLHNLIQTAAAETRNGLGTGLLGSGVAIVMVVLSSSGATVSHVQ